MVGATTPLYQPDTMPGCHHVPEQDSSALAPSHSDATAKLKDDARLIPLCQEYLAQENPSRQFVNKFAQAMYRSERVRSICRYLGRDNGVPLDRAEEVLNETLAVFFRAQIDKMREPEAIYSVIYSIADNVSKELYRDSRVLTHNHLSIEEMAEQGHEIRLNTDIHQDTSPIETIDAQQAKQEFLAAYLKHLNGEQTLNFGAFDPRTEPLMVFTGQEPDTDNNDADVLTGEHESQNKDGDGSIDAEQRHKPSRAERLSSEQRELLEIEEQLGLQHQNFAVALGIGLPRLSSYIYGRTVSVPAEVMEAARRLLAEDPEGQTRLSKFHKNMADILKDWIVDLGTSDDIELAMIFGVTKMTIFRWKTNETKPDMTSLCRYDQIVWTHRAKKKAGKAKSRKD